MSQIIKNLASGPVPPDVPIEFTTDDGTAVPEDNNLNVLGGSGIETYADPDGEDNLFIKIKNSSTDQTVTSDALGQTRTLTTIPTTADGTYVVESRVAAFEPATGFSAGLSLFALINRVGGVCTIETDTDKIAHIMGGLKPPTAVTAVDVNVLGVGANIIVQVIGIAAKTINWGGFTVYIYRGA